MLYLGYVGVTVPFAFALGALIMKYPGEKWIHITRRWTMVAWLFLTCGIFLGAHWAYEVLGWGGYWGWDPVENASLLPWLTMTAFLHSVMMQEKRGMMKMWNMWLIFTTFLLAIFGTFLTRSGVVSSVHAFAQSGIGTWFVWFLAICVRHLRVLLRAQSRDAEERAPAGVAGLARVELPVQQPGAAGVVLRGAVGHAVPGAVGVGDGHRRSRSARRSSIASTCRSEFSWCFLTGMGPLLAWRQTSLDSLKRNFVWPTALAVLTAIVLIAGGMRPWQDCSYFYSLMAISLSVLVVGDGRSASSGAAAASSRARPDVNIAQRHGA